MKKIGWRREGRGRRPLLTVLLLLVLAGAASLPVLAQEQSGSAGEDVFTTRQPVVANAAADDAAITTRLQRILESTGWFEAPAVSVREGVVFLDGATGDSEHRRWAGELASNVAGALAVVNRIEVRADLRATFGRAGEESVRLYRQFLQAWPLVVLAIVIAITTWIVARLVARLARVFFGRRIGSPLLLSVVVRAAAIPVLLLGIYFVLQVAGLTRLAVTVLGGTGLLGIIIGFAFRDIAENFLASLLLSARNPFRSGDLIEVGGHTGIVQSLNTRSTVLLTLDGNHIQIPNAIVFKSVIKNYSSIPSRRAEFLVGIGYDASVNQAQSLIADVLRRHPAVLDEPEPLVLVDQLGAATVDLRVHYWFDSAAYSPAKINSALLRLTKNALIEAGIEMPDTAREVVFPKGVPLVQSADRPPVPQAAPQLRTPPGESVSVTAEEGDLESETLEAERRAPAALPEGGENLLKD